MAAAGGRAAATRRAAGCSGLPLRWGRCSGSSSLCASSCCSRSRRWVLAWWGGWQSVGEHCWALCCVVPACFLVWLLPVLCWYRVQQAYPLLDSAPAALLPARHAASSFPVPCLLQPSLPQKCPYTLFVSGFTCHSPVLQLWLCSSRCCPPCAQPLTVLLPLAVVVLKLLRCSSHCCAHRTKPLLCAVPVAGDASRRLSPMGADGRSEAPAL